MEDLCEDKKQECQYPQESMRMQCMLKYEMKATLEQRKIVYMKSKNNATMLCYDGLYEICKCSFKAPMWILAA